jgi:FKBP12-rapamycin complex-associated protein
MVRAQMLSELEEIIAYKQFADQPERQQTIRKTWVQRYAYRHRKLVRAQKVIRLQGCQPDVEVWQRILQVRTLVLSPDDDPAMWIKFANLCRKSERMLLAEKTINSLLSQERVGLSPREFCDRSDLLHISSTRKHLRMLSTPSLNICGHPVPRKKA